MTKTFEGNLTAKAGEVYQYTEITGFLDVSIYKRGSDFTAAFPILEKVGGDLDLNSLTDAKGLTLPQSIGGDLYLHSLTDAKGLTLPQSIGGGLDLRSLTDAKGLTLPQSIGGYLYLHSLTDAPKIKTNDDETRTLAQNRCRAMLLPSFAAAGFSFADGILAKIVSQRGHVSRVIICGKTEVSYVLSDDEGNYAHGDTLDEARADLMVKRTSRDLSQFKGWKLDKVVSKSDAIFAYRSITGACAKGTRHWLELHKTPDEITVAGIIAITNGAYGSDAFKKFFAEAK